MPLLFSYGTLQEVAVQMTLFGRRLEAHPDELVGFELSTLRIRDPEFTYPNGDAEYKVVTRSRRAESRVRGVVLEVTDADLAVADQYEPAEYRRVSAQLASGREVWVYVDARDP